MANKNINKYLVKNDDVAIDANTASALKTKQNCLTEKAKWTLSPLLSHNGRCVQSHHSACAKLKDHRWFLKPFQL